jgi:hypothetical protein
MRSDILQRLGLGALAEIKNNPTFPVKTGNLKNTATWISFVGETTFIIHFDETLAPYIKYLENGTKEGEYKDKKGKTRYYKGSKKHVGFISERATNDILTYLAKQFNIQGKYTLLNNKKQVFKGGIGQ